MRVLGWDMQEREFNIIIFLFLPSQSVQLDSNIQINITIQILSTDSLDWAIHASIPQTFMEHVWV